MDPKSSLSYVNKAYILCQCRQDLTGSEECLRKAIEVDKFTEIAYVQLAQIIAHKNVEEAIKVYDQGIAIARGESELFNLYTGKVGACAQDYVIKTYPHVVEGFLPQL
jgi:hypothetical protein